MVDETVRRQLFESLDTLGRKLTAAEEASEKVSHDRRAAVEGARDKMQNVVLPALNRIATEAQGKGHVAGAQVTKRVDAKNPGSLPLDCEFEVRVVSGRAVRAKATCTFVVDDNNGRITREWRDGSDTNRRDPWKPDEVTDDVVWAEIAAFLGHLGERKR